MKLIMTGLFALLLLFASVDIATAQTSGDEKTYTDKIVPIEKEGRSFTIEPSYYLSQMIAGTEAALTITLTSVSSPDSSFLEIKALPVINNRDAAELFQFTNAGENSTGGVVRSRTYHYIVKISDKVEARRYQVKVDFGFPQGHTDQEILSRYFYLYVGVLSKGRLQAAPEEEESQPPTFEAGMFSNKLCTYELNLRNSFPDYTVSIESIKIQSDPPGLIVPKEFVFENGISLTPAQEKAIPLQFELAPLTIRNLIRGLGSTPKIKADVIYNDGNKRRISDFKPRTTVSVSPTNRVVLGSVLVGLLFGAVIRAVLEFLLFQKQITRNAVIKVVSYSLLFGVLLVLLAVAGKIEIKAFEVSGSYDNPLAMLMIGLVGALAGLQIIIGWYKSLKAN